MIATGRHREHMLCKCTNFERAVAKLKEQEPGLTIQQIAEKLHVSHLRADEALRILVKKRYCRQAQ